MRTQKNRRHVGWVRVRLCECDRMHRRTCMSVTKTEKEHENTIKIMKKNVETCLAGGSGDVQNLVFSGF